MPTAARLVAALSLAILGFVVSGQIKGLMPEGTGFGYFTYVNIGLGIITGWRLVGARIGRGVVGALNNGITGMAVMVMAGLVLQGAVKMFDLAHRRIYDDPFEAVGDVFANALEYFFIMAVPHVLITLVVGGALAGLLTENAARRWR